MYDRAMRVFSRLEMCRRTFLSAYRQNKNIECAFETSVSNYLVKRFFSTDLVARITADLCRGKTRITSSRPTRGTDADSYTSK